jgi:hypothetical protein
VDALRILPAAQAGFSGLSSANDVVGHLRATRHAVMFSRRLRSEGGPGRPGRAPEILGCKMIAIEVWAVRREPRFALKVLVRVVRAEGFEPSPRFRDRDLNPARLPDFATLACVLTCGSAPTEVLDDSFFPPFANHLQTKIAEPCRKGLTEGATGGNVTGGCHPSRQPSASISTSSCMSSTAPSGASWPTTANRGTSMPCEMRIR